MPSINLFPSSFVAGASFSVRDPSGGLHHIHVIGEPDGPTQILSRGLEPYEVIKVDLVVDGEEDWAKVIFPASYDFKGEFTINNRVYLGYTC